MAPVSPPKRTAHQRATHARSVQLHGRDSPQAAEAKRDLEVAKLADRIQRVAAQHPALTDEQHALLAELLEPPSPEVADYLKRTLAEAPPLTEAQRVKLAELLRPAREYIAARRRAALRGRVKT
ncbi:hypothetical protein [Mycobacterium sp. E3305]|uniref:hypothetical protein n=1 Tax=Mycobacterium sp. E3305 TaxID=1834145 RepID=UPI0008011D26|nr:hypothetical protein [Mycobacterium sp. E3305]OBG70286.1 hypothetical protein A5701_03605 [Mycobacterium sp. E3305]